MQRIRSQQAALGSAASLERRAWLAEDSRSHPQPLLSCVRHALVLGTVPFEASAAPLHDAHLISVLGTRSRSTNPFIRRKRVFGDRLVPWQRRRQPANNISHLSQHLARRQMPGGWVKVRLILLCTGRGLERLFCTLCCGPSTIAVSCGSPTSPCACASLRDVGGSCCCCC